MATTLLQIKIIALAVIWVIAIIFGTLPALVETLIRRKGNSKQSEVKSKIISSLHFVAGGVFLGTILLHLIPSVEMQFKASELGVIEYPIAQLIIALGLIVFLLLEHSIIFWMETMRKKGYNDLANLLEDEKEEVHFMRHYNEKTEYGAVQSDISCHKRPTLTEDTDKVKEDTKNKTETIKNSETDDKSDNEEDENGVVLAQNDDEAETTMLLRSYAIVIALSLHSIFEGMVIGFQKTHNTAWSMLGALAFHKALVAFSLGQKLTEVRSRINTRHLIGIIVAFSLMPPIGGAIAMAMSGDTTSASTGIACAILEGLATGSFMYVTFFDMLKFESGQRLNLWYSTMIIVGFICISVQMIFMPMSSMVLHNKSNSTHGL